MQRRQLVLPILLITALPALAARAEILLSEQTVSINRSSNIFDVSHFDLDLVFGDNPFVPSNEVILFDGLIVSPADVGSVYEANSGTEFDTVSARVTDALNEYITVSMTEDQPDGLGDGRISFEDAFFDRPFPANPPDLAGNVIERVTLEIDSFTLAGPQALVEGQPVDLVVTISFFGIPEPQTIALLGLGLASYAGSFILRRPRG